MPGSRILVVDDEAPIRRFLQLFLELANYDVALASGGAQGLEILRSDESIGLVLLDLAMPGVDGWQFRAQQRADPMLDLIPTVIVTGLDLTPEACDTLQAADYLTKPVSRERLLAVAATYCGAQTG